MMLAVLIFGAVAGGITALAGRTTEEIAAAGISGLAVGAFVSMASETAPAKDCLDAIEYLVVSGTAEVRVGDDAVHIKTDRPRVASSVLVRCSAVK